MESGVPIDLAVLGPVPLEIEALSPLLDGSKSFRFLGHDFWTGTREGRYLVIGATGLGKVNAAATTGALLARFAVRQVWNIGTAGAYETGHLDVGDVLIAQKELCGDEGVLSTKGVQSVREIGIPIVVGEGFCLYDEVPMDWSDAFKAVQRATPHGIYHLCVGSSRQPAVLCAAANSPNDRRRSDQPGEGASPEVSGAATAPNPARPQGECFRVLYGPILTVGMSSGDAETAQKRFLRYRALAENMEGSAVAQTGFLFRVPVLECRGISNMAGDRNKDHWEMEKAIAHCHGVVLHWLSCLPRRGNP
jgi:futalosine hydrolase